MAGSSRANINEKQSSRYHYKNVAAPQSENIADTPIPMANLEGEPTAFVNGHVNVITGDFNDFQVDLTVPGVDPITVERSFSGCTERDGSLAAGWNLNLHGTLDSRINNKDGTNYSQVLVMEGHGATSIYEKEYIKNDKSIAPVSLSRSAYKKGVTNTSAGVISAQTNIKNNKVYKINDDIYRVYNGAKGVKEYTLPTKFSESFRLFKELKPSGNLLQYHYLEWKRHPEYERGTKDYHDVLDLVEIKSPDNRLMGSVTYVPIKQSDYKKFPHQDVIAGDGRKVRYYFETHSKHDRRRDSILKKIERSDGPTEHYHYIDGENDADMLICRKNRPEGRYLRIKYYGKGDEVGENGYDVSKKNDRRINRVKALQAPVGHDRTPINTHRFYYSFNSIRGGYPKNGSSKSGSTTVLDALDNKTIYSYSTDQRLRHVDKFSSDGNIYSRESLYWGAYRSEQCSYLLARTLASASGSLAFAREYSYDNRGNVLKDSLYGNLSGHNETAPVISEEGCVIENGCEKFQKQFKYSDDGFNLLLWESDGFHETTYEYESNSNKLSAKFIGAPHKIHLREFYEYNIEAALTQKIVDDGCSKDKNDLSGVTERHITYFIPRTIYPFGYPEVVIEKYLDLTSGQEIQKNKAINTHNNQGLLVKQMLFDSSDKYLYTLYWEYNSMGKLTREIDALQRVSEWRYDVNGNCVYEQGPNPNYHKEFTYDFANRLTRQDEIHSDGITRSVSYRYNLLSQPIAVKDSNGNETFYEYDAFGRVTHITYPPIMDEAGVISSPTSTKCYDLMGNVIRLIDSKGNEKIMSYTLRGQIANAFFHDGSCESNIYNIDGTLKSTKAKNGTLTSFTYDTLGNNIKTEITSPSGKLLSSTSATYNAFHVISETDAMGQSIFYEYYPDGKIKSTRSGKSLLSYTYDSLGRLKTSCEHYGPSPEDVIIKIQEYDVLNRVIEERTEDYSGIIFTKVNRSYDISGNIIETHFGDGSITSTSYDSHGTPNILTDSEGNQTLTKRCFNTVNALGQFVNYKEVIDALGNVTCITCDALSRPVSTIRKNNLGKLLQQQEIAYDINGNSCRLIDTIFSGTSIRKVVTKLFYDNLNRLITCHEAADTPEQKITQINYNLVGQKSSLIKADGTIIYHSYDDLGRLTEICSSDNTIHYVYTYDPNNHPIRVEDLINKTSTTNEYDSNGQMIKEILGNGFSLNYSFDAMGRPINVTLPDSSGFAFKYRGSYLDKAQRLAPEGSVVYEHAYTGYDELGRLTEANLIGNAGKLKYSYDKIGRLKSAKADCWEETLAYDPVGNLIEQWLNDSQGEVTTRFNYSDLYQLLAENGITRHDYHYDSHYNRIQKDDKIHVHNDLNQILDDGEALYTYDLNGNLLRKVSAVKTIDYTYDAFDRLISMTDNDKHVRYRYDELNRRLSKEIYHKGIAEEAEEWLLEKSLRYIYQGQNEIGSFDSDGKIIELRLLGIGKGAEIGAAVAIEIGEQVFAPVHDHAGHVVCLIDASTGVNAETYRYSAFGEELFEKAMSPWRFSSKRVDDESGLVYFGRRYYDPNCGRWISQDPIGRDGGPNLYAYVLNNPLTSCDLYGLAAIFMYGENWQKRENTVKFSALAEGILRFPGKCIEQAAFHLIPFSGIKDAVGCVGWTLQGKNPMSFTPSWNRAKSQIYYYPGYGNTFPNERLLLFNGVCNSMKDCHKSCAQISHDNGGADVYGIYNSTNGLVGDIIEVAFQKLGISTEAQRSAGRDVRTILDGMGEYKKNAHLIVKAHSQGCETVHNLSPELKKVTGVDAYGPARVLRSSEFGYGAKNYLSPCDWITYVSDPIGLVRGMYKGNVEFLKTRGCPFGCHCLGSPTYASESERSGYLYYEKRGRVYE